MGQVIILYLLRSMSRSNVHFNFLFNFYERRQLTTVLTPTFNTTKIMIKYLFLTAFLAISTACSSEAKQSSQTEEKEPQSEVIEQNRELPDTMTIAMCGDIMMGTTFPSVQLPANEGKDLFKDTKEYTLAADLAVGNLEGAVCEGGSSTKGSGPNSYSFRMPTRFAPLLMPMILVSMALKALRKC